MDFPQSNAVQEDILEKFRKGELLVHMRHWKPWDSKDFISPEQAALLELQEHSLPTTTSQQIKTGLPAARCTRPSAPPTSTQSSRVLSSGTPRATSWTRRSVRFTRPVLWTLKEQLIKDGGARKADGILQLAKFASQRKSYGAAEFKEGHVPCCYLIDDIDPAFPSERQELHAIAEISSAVVEVLQGGPEQRREQAKAGLVTQWKAWMQDRFYFPVYRQGSHTEMLVNCSVDALLGAVFTSRGNPEGFDAVDMEGTVREFLTPFLKQVARDVPQLRNRPLVLARYLPGGGVDETSGEGCLNKYCGDTCAAPDELKPADLQILEVINGPSR
ncbi:unnamed protein product [Polarella glacialis]|uniref:Uncharacterized protein n=1 Tax=Polarella glacialis TaxID=89957 RepID=A0A813KJC3_POLGL|nr:unnamed protein product [Polarella glacialis]